VLPGPAGPAGKETPKPGEPAKPPPGTKPRDAAPGAVTDALAGPARTEDIYQETVITASRGAQSPLDSPNSTTIITRQDIRLSGMTRVPELLRRVAGMDVMQITGGDSNVSMRGFNSRLANKFLILVNGRSVYNDVLGSTFWEALSVDVDQIERIEIVRGPGSALYGANAFAGVVNIILIDPGEGKNGLRVGAGDHQQLYGSTWVTGRDGDFAYRASAGYTRYPRWTREVADGRRDIEVEDVDQNLGAENARINVNTSRRFGPHRELTVGGDFARSTLDVYGIGPLNDYHATFNNAEVYSAFRSEYITARLYYARFSADAAANHAHIGHTRYVASAQQNSLDGEVQFVKAFTAPSFLLHDIHLGVGYRLKNISWAYLRDDLPVEHHISGFLQDTLKFGKYVQLVASGRVDYVPYLKRLIPSPRGSLVVRPTERQSIRASGSTAFRSPTFLESYLDLPIQLQLPGLDLHSTTSRRDDPDFRIQPEQIINAELSYLNQQSDYFEFEVTAYYNRIAGLIGLDQAHQLTLSDRQDGIGGINPESGHYTVATGGWRNVCGVYNVFGGEAGTRIYPVEGLDVFANYALNLSSRQLPEGCTQPEDQRTSRHKINVGVQVRSKIGIDGEVTFHYQSAQSWLEQVATLSGIVDRTFELPQYTLLNARLGYRFLKDRVEVSATAFNILAGAIGDPPQMHPFGNRIDRRFMGFLALSL
jgi:iron complex outermembrane receptor protein